MLSGAVGPTARRTLAEYARYHAPLTMRAATTSQMNSGARLALAEAEGRPWGLRRDSRVLRVTAIVALIRWTAGVALNGTCLQYRGGTMENDRPDLEERLRQGALANAAR